MTLIVNPPELSSANPVPRYLLPGSGRRLELHNFSVAMLAVGRRRDKLCAKPMEFL